MLRQKAFENTGNKMLKGGLHCHTTRSDGKGEPGEVIKLHKEHGYDFLAITDHRRYNFKDFAPDAGVTIIPGMEFDSEIKQNPENHKGFRCYHTVCIGPADDKNGYSQDEHMNSGSASSQFEFQKYLDIIHSKNNLTFYCHPEWSSTPARYFDRLTGNFAMEIWNSGCVIENDMDKNAPYWDELLGEGVRVFGVATDDGHAMNQHCNGWVMVNSKNSVNDILEALKNGCFYSSCGPVIKDFYVDGTVAHIETEPCEKILFHSDKHPTHMVSSKNGELITSAELDLKDDYEYIRASVLGKDGKRAWTNPIFLSE